MANLLNQLNEKQKEAVLQTQGPVLILAGAGSGKTRALTFRVAYLIQEKKIAPRNILAVTFTNKAAGEMLDRIKKLLGLPFETPSYSQYLPHIGTFHSICVRILRKEIEKIGYKSNFIIYDDQDQLVLMKKVMKRLEISVDQIKPKAILNVISANKNKLLDYQDFKNQVSSQFEDLSAKCYEFYQQELKRAEALDFDDIIMKTVELFKKYPEILEKYQDLFQYIMVDEYQDTNHAQYFLLKMISQKHKNICVVGDDWQSIYGWRQADIKNILNFEKDYLGAKVILLEQNYRSTQNILDAAHCVISKNVNRKDKKLWTENDKGDLLSVVEIDDEVKESMFVVSEIERIKKERNIRYDVFAILYRTNAQSRALEEAFMRKNIPYKIIGGVKFYQRKEVKDILAYLYFINNPLDKISFERIINIPKRGIGGKTVEKILTISEINNCDILDTILKVNSQEKSTIHQGKVKSLVDFAKLIKELQVYAKENSVSKLIQKIYQKSGYELMLSKLGEEGQTRHENIQELLSVSDKYDDEKDGMQMFLEEVALVSQTDRDLEVQDAVPLMTLHSAKGLEFDTIFIVGMEEGVLPHNRAMLNEKEMEEERRLCYVGITRAQQTAFLTFTNSRKIFGSTQISLKSRFLDEIDSELIEQKNLTQFFIEDLNDEEGISIEEESEEGVFKDGEKVRHPDFGSGIVVGQDQNLISVVFPGVGIKKFAKNIGILERE